MQQQRVAFIRNLLALRSLTLTVPKCLGVFGSSSRQLDETASLSFCRYITQATSTPTTKTKAKADDQKSKQFQQKITLIGQNQSISVTTLEEAQKLAKRRDLHLVRSQQPDAKTGRVVFKLVTAAEMLADESLSSKSGTLEKGSKKSEKSLTIGARMTDHDLSSRLKNIIKWLNKQHEVRILIQGNVTGTDATNAERICKSIETTIKEPQVIGRVVQKRQKGGFIKFSIIPVVNEKEDTKVATTAKPTSSPTSSKEAA